MPNMRSAIDEVRTSALTASELEAILQQRIDENQKGYEGLYDFVLSIGPHPDHSHNICVICQAEHEPADEVLAHKCHNAFHAKCITSWFEGDRRRKTCLLCLSQCRTDISPEAARLLEARRFDDLQRYTFLGQALINLGLTGEFIPRSRDGNMTMWQEFILDQTILRATEIARCSTELDVDGVSEVVEARLCSQVRGEYWRFRASEHDYARNGYEAYYQDELADGSKTAIAYQRHIQRSINEIDAFLRRECGIALKIGALDLFRPYRG